MRKLSLLIAAVIVSAGLAGSAYASDWDVAGKVLTGVEGLRIITGGRVDPVGSMIGVVFGSPQQRQGGNERGRSEYGRSEHGRNNRHVQRGEYTRVWVPHYAWIREWVPGHREYSTAYRGMIFVEGRYVHTRVERGGHWETRYLSEGEHCGRDRY